MEKHLLFDSSALISLSLTGSLELLEKLKQDYGGKFVVPMAVKQEVVDNALRTQRFKYGGYKIKELIDKGVLNVLDESAYKNDIQRLSSLANSTFSAHGQDIKIIQSGEIALLVIAHYGSEDDAVVIDERTTRLLVETPEQIPALLGGKLHAHINTDEGKLAKLRKEMTSVSIIRSADLCLAAYRKGYLDSNKDMFDGLLWAVKFAGCSISGKEIKEYMQYIRQEVEIGKR